MLKDAVHTHCAINPLQALVVGVSGGGDSLALMHGLHTLGFQLIVAHLDHDLRQESQSEASFVAREAERLDVPFVSGRVDVRSAAIEKSQSIEEAARDLRYRFLFDQARQYHAQAVAVGHQADDQVETVLMHFIRGSARGGLSGMPYRTVLPQWDSEIPLVRPLLGVWRSEIDAYLQQLNLTPCVDLSNADTTYYRNRLRHDLIPELETYNPRFKDAMLRMADVLSAEDRYLEVQVDAAWQRCLIAADDQRVILDLPAWQTVDRALQRRILRRAVALLQPDLRDVGYDVVERGYHFLTDPGRSGEVDLVAGLTLTCVEETAVVKTRDAELPDRGSPQLVDASFQQTFSPGETVALKPPWIIETKVLINLPEDHQRKAGKWDSNIVWLDADRLAYPLEVRGRQAGERWSPLGLGNHTQALTDFFINEKIPAHLRERWPLVCSAGEAAWVVGLRPSEKFRVTPATQKILQLALRQVY